MRELLSPLLVMLLITAQLLAQNHRTIKGKVSDDRGVGIPNSVMTLKVYTGKSFGVPSH